MRSSSLERRGRGSRTPDDTSSKTNPRMEKKERMGAVDGAQRGSRGRSSGNHRRHSPFEAIDSSERSFRKPSSELDDWTVQEADVGGDIDGYGDVDEGDEGDEGDVWYGESEVEDEIYPGKAL